MIQSNNNGKLQRPLGTGFNAQSTSSEVIGNTDLSNKIAIVTGGNAGIGVETTRTLAAAGATVIVPARDTDKAAKNLAGIPNVEIMAMDMMQPGSIEAFAQQFLASGRPLHLLINNAGIMWVPLRRDERGLESQLATNYVGAFHLTSALWPALKKAKGARVVNVSSLGHHMAPFDFYDPNFLNREYQTLQAYGQSKTACNLFTLELDNRAKDFLVRAYAVHPGSIGGTELAREAPVELLTQMGFLDENGNIKAEVAASLKTIPQGAATTIWAATSPQLETIGGVYCEDGDIAQLLEADGTVNHQSRLYQSGVMPYSLDHDNAKRLWTLTGEMTGIEFDVM